MSATYTMLSQSEKTTIPISEKKKSSGSSLFRASFPTRAQSSSKRICTAPIKARGIVGKDPGELSIRASMARKKAFQMESFESGDYGADIDIDSLDDEDEKDMEDLKFLMGYACQDLVSDEKAFIGKEKKQMQPVGGRERGARQKSFATRLLNRGS
ncbi:MAG: hypothetical protein Q9209_001861 [Squamulea sp. 1 TL-2023]